MDHMYNLNFLDLGLTIRLRSLLIKIKTKYNINLLNVTQKKNFKILSTLKSAHNVKSYLKSVLREGGGTGMRRKTKKREEEKEEKEEEEEEICL